MKGAYDCPAQRQRSFQVADQEGEPRAQAVSLGEETENGNQAG